jgi:hypothetical protein
VEEEEEEQEEERSTDLTPELSVERDERKRKLLVLNCAAGIHFFFEMDRFCLLLLLLGIGMRILALGNSSPPLTLDHRNARSQVWKLSKSILGSLHVRQWGMPLNRRCILRAYHHPRGPSREIFYNNCGFSIFHANKSTSTSTSTSTTLSLPVPPFDPAPDFDDPPDPPPSYQFLLLIITASITCALTLAVRGCQESLHF